ncbi:MAG: PAS domain S-box protein [Deltaproteobacteria bacterium]|nr:PAS domain S-box protein [Deltaproteobacteria bacterium]
MYSIRTKQHYLSEGMPVSSGDNCLNIKTEMMFREIEERYRSFFESIEQGYYEVDIYGNFIFFNDFICKILGYSKEELMGKNFSQFIDKEDSGKVIYAFRDVSAAGKPRIGLVFQIIRKDGVKRQIGTSVCLIKDIKDKKIGFRGIARDISERKNMENQLKQTQKMESIGQLASGIAHEINTPIQYIGDNVRFLQDSVKEIELVLNSYRKLYETVKSGLETGPAVLAVEAALKESDLDYLNEEIPRAIEQSLEGVDHVSEIVLAMKQFCHPGSEEKRATDINKSIKNVLTVARNEWKYVADIITDLDSTLPPVPCIPGEINQVILNLIINAAHAIEDVLSEDAGDKGTIRVSTYRDGSWVEIRVSDTGGGIPKDIRSRIFDPFYTTKDVGKGSGQGLAISHSVIVKKHGGSIEFETEMGKGTTMIIRLPLEIRNG